VESGYWLLAVGYWLLAVGYWLLAVGFELPNVRNGFELSALSLGLSAFGF
jgi:hypothetical protein